MNIEKNHNLIRIAELTDILTLNEVGGEYKFVVKELKDIVDEGKDKISKIKTPTSKIRCYETMCSKITKILTDIKFI